MGEAATLEILNLPANNYVHKLPVINTGTIEDYISYVNSIPMLTEAEELEYAQKLQQNGDLHAAHCLVMAHLRYVVRVSKRYLGYGLPLADLIQEGTVGLMKAVRKFDVDKNVRLVTFALHWIKAEIHEFILKNWRIVKIATTKAQRKLFFKLRSSKKNFNWLNNQEIEQIAIDLKVKPKDVKQMELRIFNKDNCFDESESFDATANPQRYEKSFMPAEYLQDLNFNPELILEKTQWEKIAFSKLHNAIINLDPRSQDILRRRWLQNDEKSTLQDLALEYGVSKERIRQLESQAMVALQEHLREYI
jgi:RNA polymerase sigma-32 factor